VNRTFVPFALLVAVGGGCKGASSRSGLGSTQAPPALTGTTAEAPPTPPPSDPPPVLRGNAAIPNPLISRGKPVFATSLVRYAHPEAVDDGVYNTFAGTWNAGSPSASQPATVAIHVGAGPKRVLVEWSAAGNFNYTDTEYGSPGSYRIETSSDSRDGSDGTWKVAATNTNCTVHAQEHVVDFGGQSWVRMVITGMPPKSPNGVQLDEIEVYDVSDGVGDSWFFFGDSITALTFNRTTPDHQPSFAALIHEKYPRFFPAMINGGIGGERMEQAAARLDACLALNPDMRFWAIGFGTNDAAGNNVDTSSYRQLLSTVITKVKAAGHIPIVAKIPFSSDGSHETAPAFNRVIAELTAQNDLLPGPDLYAWFAAHPEQLRDGIHPTDAGILAINRLWAEAVARAYAR
jgi:lysophospholipase L1-like esterase